MYKTKMGLQRPLLVLLMGMTNDMVVVIFQSQGLSWKGVRPVQM